MYFPILISLKNYVSQSIDELLVNYFSEDWKKVNQNQLLVLLDGFDEIKSDERDNFLRRLGFFVESNPAANVLISSRTNFITDSTLLPDFKEYILPEFDDADIRNYAEKLIESDRVGEFYSYVEKYKIQNWISSPFNLSNFINLFNEDAQNLPKTRIELVEKIIDFKLKKDFEKYRIEISKQIAYKKIINKLAYSYNLCGVNSVSFQELITVFGEDEIETLKKISLINFTDDSITFQHNVLQEYLSAQILAKQPYENLIQIITFKNNEVIKPKWYNTIGILIEILEPNSTLLSDILLFVSRKDPSILNLIEYKFIPPQLRLEAFKIIISDAERLYKRQDIYSDRLVKFGGLNENEEVLEFLLKLIKTQKNEIRTEAIYCLRWKEPEKLWGYETQIIETLSKVIDETENYEDYSIQLCVQALNDLKIIDEKVAEKLIKIINKTDNFRLIDEILEYLNLSEKTENQIDLFLSCITVLEQYKKRDKSISGLGGNLQKGLKTIKTIKNLHKLLDYLIENIDKVYDNESIFIHKFYFETDENTFFKSLANNLTEAYKFDKSLITKIIIFLEKSNFRGHEEYAKDLVKFFFETKTNTQTFWKIWNDKKDKTGSDKLSLGFLADEKILENCKNLFLSRKITEDQIWSLIHYLNWVKRYELSEKFRDDMNVVSDNNFQYQEQIDYNSLQEKKRLKDLELLMDKIQFREKAIQFFEYYDKNELTQDEIFAYRRNWEESDNEVVGYFLNLWFQGVENKKEHRITKSQIMQWFKNESNWDWMVADELHRRKKKELNSECLVFIQNWCDKKLIEIDFKTAITEKGENSISTRWNEIYLSNFYLFVDVFIPESIQLEMLSFDMYGSGMHSNDKAQETITEKVLRLLGKEKVATTILENLKTSQLPFTVLENHISWCEKLGLSESKPLIKTFIEKYHQRSEYRLQKALDTYLSFGGDMKELHFIFNIFDTNNEFHWYLLEKMAEHNANKNRIFQLLSSKVQPSEINENLYKASLILIDLGFIDGLRWYILWYQSQMRLTDRDKFIKSIERLNFDETLPLIKDLLGFILNQRIGEVRFDPIGQIFQLLKIAGFRSEENFEKVRRMVEDLFSFGFFNENLFRFRYVFSVFSTEYYLQKIEYKKFAQVKYDFIT